MVPREGLRGEQDLSTQGQGLSLWQEDGIGIGKREHSRLDLLRSQFDLEISMQDVY